MNNSSLPELRKQIDALDLELLSLLAKRRVLAVDVARSKIGLRRQIRDKERERDLLERLVIAGQKLALDRSYITSIYQMIIEDSVLIQQKVLQQVDRSVSIARIAFLGPEGSYSHLAAKQYSASNSDQMIVECSCRTFADVLQLIEAGKVDYAVLPIENSYSGSISDVYCLLQRTNLPVVKEITVPIEHCILASINSPLDQIKTIYSHPQPFQQCSKFLINFPQWKIEYCESTSVAMKKVAQLNHPTAAALGSRQGSVIYGLQVLKSDIANQQQNNTRFVVLSKKE